MHWIIQFIRQHKNFSSLLLTVVISLMMLSVDTEQQSQIARTLTITIFFPFQFTMSQVSKMGNFFIDNKKLKEEITFLRTECAILQEAAMENERLRQLVGIQDRYSYSLLSAQTVVHDPSYNYRTIIINVGKRDSVVKYMPVVNKDGVVGKIIQVLPRVSVVQLLRDPTGRIGVMLKKNSVAGILGSKDGKRFFVQYRKHTKVVEGDSVVTSGLGGIYPKGIYVGLVKEVRYTNDPLFKTVYIKPFVDFDHVFDVFVIKLSPQWQAVRSELDSIGVK